MQNTPESEKEPSDRLGFRSRLLRWAVVLVVALTTLLIPVPEGVTPQSWRLLAIFAAIYVAFGMLAFGPLMEEL